MRSLSSARLSFSRDGRWLVAVERDAVSLRSPDGRTTTHVAAPGAFAAIGFADQLWIASDATAPQLTRYALDGAPLGAAIRLDAGASEPMLIAAPLGPPAAVWPAPLSSVIVEGVVRSLAGLAIPLTGHRFVTSNGARAIAPSGVAIELGGRAVAGNVLGDGVSAVFVVDRDLVLVGLGNGRVQLRRRLDAREVRVAVQCGHVALRAPDRIAIFDLRSGRVRCEHVCGDDVTDFAISPDGTWLALRAGDGTPRVCRLDATPPRRACEEPEAPEVDDDGEVPLQLEKSFVRRSA